MPIYDLFENQDLEVCPSSSETTAEKVHSLFQNEKEKKKPSKDRFFSTLAARVFFLFLFVGDVFWGLFSLTKLLLFSALTGITFGKISLLKNTHARAYLSFKRSLICLLALFVALIAPPLGIMIACSYFLMYDKEGIDEIVPSVLREQFKEFFP